MKNEAFPFEITKQGTTLKIYRSKHPKTKSGWIFQLCYHSGGKRFVRQFADFQKAKKEGELKAEMLAAGQLDAARMSKQDRDELLLARDIAGDIPIVEAISQWKRMQDITKGNGLEAAKLWNKANLTAFENIKLEEVIRRFKAAKERAGVNVESAYKNRLERLTATFPKAFLSRITTRQLSAYLDKIDHPVSRNTHRKNLLTLWSWCRKQGYLPDTIRTEAEKTERAQEEDGSQVEIITPDVAESVLRLIENEHAEYLPAAILAIFTGVRRGEIHGQVWEDINLEESRLHVTKAKPRTPADRLVEIPSAGMEWFIRCGNRKGRVCQNLAMDRIRKICDTAGLDLPRNCFRHSFITYKMALGLSAGQVAGIAGTSERQIHKHYRRPRPKSEAEKWFSLSPKVVLKDTKVVSMEQAQ